MILEYNTPLHVHNPKIKPKQTHIFVHSLTQCGFLLQRELLQKIKTKREVHNHQMTQTQVSSMFLAYQIKFTSLDFLTSTFTGRSLIIFM
jgi:hypothetical protein